MVSSSFGWSLPRLKNAHRIVAAGGLLWHDVLVATLLIDSHRLISNLKNRGYTEEQATGFKEAVEEIDLSQLATKEDIRELHFVIRDIEIRILRWAVPLLVGQAAVFAAIVKWL